MAGAAPVARLARTGRRTSSVAALIALASTSAHEFLTEKLFKIAWTTVLSAHIVLGCSRLTAATFHVRMADPEAYAAVTMIRIPRDVLMATGWTMGAVAMLHLACAVAIITFSVRAKKLTFWSKRPSPLRLPQLPSALVGTSDSLITQHSRAHACLAGLLRRLKVVTSVIALQVDAVFGVDGLVGVNGPFFVLFFDVLELLEVLTQTYQAYQLSRFVSSPAFNAFIVAMIFANGVLPPAVQYAVRKRKRSSQRLMLLVVDLWLDLIYAEAVPALVIFPIMTNFDWNVLAFPPAVSFDTVWANNAVAQTRFVLVTSFLDLATTLVPQLNFIMGLQLLKSLLHHRADVRDVVLRPSDPKTLVYLARPAPQPRRRQRVLAQWWSQLFRVGLFAWGAAVLVIHIHSQGQHSTIDGCRARLTPWRLWSVNATPCAVMDVDCAQRGLRGHADEVQRVLRQLDRNVVTTVVFVHCPALVVPPEVAAFHRLIAVEFYNSTLVEWGAQAALTRTHHRSLHHMFFFETNMTALPEAIVHGELPLPLQYIAVHTSNLSRLPDAIGIAWSNSTTSVGRRRWRVLSFINTGLLDLPASFGMLAIDSLQLINNSMPRLPDAVAQTTGGYNKLRISGAQFRELPAHMSAGADAEPRLRRLYMEHSSVATLPAWLTAWLDAPGSTALPPFDKVSLHGSRVCGEADYATYARFCQPDVQFDIDAVPLDIIRMQWEH